MSTYQVRSLEEADQIIKEHERKTKTLYALLRSTKNFGCVNLPACSNDEHEVRFETVGVPYCGVPFFVSGLKILQCQSYKGRGNLRKKNERERKIKVEIDNINGNGSVNELAIEETYEEELPQKTILSKKKKKSCRPHQVGCTATIIMKEVIYYPEFRLFEHSRNHRIANARQLKEAFKSKNPVQKDRIIYVTVPSPSDHYGHNVALGSPKPFPFKRKDIQGRVYVKNDFYGSNEPGPSKRIYYPVKQEKVVIPQLSKKLKVDVDDTEARAKEVREMLQSIMALTYKPGTAVAYHELLQDLLQSKLRYQHTMESIMIGLPVSSSSILTVETSQPAISTFTPTHQVLTVQPSPSKVLDGSTVTLSSGWQNRVNTPMSINTTVIPGSVVAVTALPLSVTTSSAGNGVVSVTSPVTVQHTSSSANGSDANSQETSIFIEAMEAIFNSQM